MVSRHNHLDIEEILRICVRPAVDQGDENVRAEIDQYIRSSAGRGPFIVDLLMQAVGTTPALRVLEVGSSPYVITRYLLAAVPTMHLVALDHPDVIWPGSSSPPEKQTITFEMPDSNVIEVPHWLLNAERDRFPFEDHMFDAVICTDTLEHLLLSPTHLLCEIHRVLQAVDGVLVFTVPNSLSLKYLASQLLNRPTLHQYTGYGVYGGHRREYSLWEVQDLMNGCGFRVMRAFTKNFRVPLQGRKAALTRLLALVSDLPVPYLANKREHVVAVARATGQITPYYPSWLYKSMHLSWMRQIYPDYGDSWITRYAEIINDVDE
jgi:SAM-dependent methyltransferase